MVRRSILCAFAAAAIIPAGGVLAQHAPGGGPPGGMPSGAMGSPGGMSGGMQGGMSGGMHGGMQTDMNSIGVQTRDQARMNSQGPANASATGVAHANSNSVLAGTTSGGTTLTGITTGMALMQGTTQVGTVQRIVTNGKGVITRVMVTGTNGRTYSLSPHSLSLSGGVLSTTATLQM